MKFPSSGVQDFHPHLNPQECKIEMTVEKLADNTVRLLADKVLLYDDVREWGKRVVATC